MKVNTREEFDDLSNVLTAAYIGLARMREEEAKGTLYARSPDEMDKSLQEIGLLLADYQRKYIGA